MLEELLYIVLICYMQKQKYKMTNLLKRFIDDGFGIMNGNKKNVQTCTNEFNNLHKNIFKKKVAYLEIKGNKLKFIKNQKSVTCIPFKSTHPWHTIKNYVSGKLNHMLG